VADTLAVVGSPDALCDGRANVYDHQLGTFFLILGLRDRVSDLGENRDEFG
jgi:hypothetical protein